MTATFVVYIDESGDEGFAFDRGSSAWFVLSAVIVKKTEELVTVKLVDTVRRLLEKPDKKPLHFRDLRHEHRLPFIDQIAQAPLRTVSVLVHKPSLKEPETFQERYRLYFYAVRYLFERVSWYCRDHRIPHDTGDGSAEIIFSNRSGMSYNDLREYLVQLERQTGYFDVRIDWRVIKPDQIIAYSAGRRMGLQIADAVAGSCYYAVELSKYGYTENRYTQMLKPVVYHRRGRYLGYGLKFWPREVETLLTTDERFAWVQSTYQ
jgi:hypothetical protein